MRRWLTQNTSAIPPVYCVTAYDTVGQSIFTAAVTHALGIKKLTVITSNYHIPRTRAIFEKVHSACCELGFIGAEHPVENPDAVTQHEKASLAVFMQKFARATNIFDCMAILFDHHPRYQRIAIERINSDPDSQDSKFIWEWKNDPVTREMSRRADVIPWQNHRSWYASAVMDPKKVLLMACVNGIPASMLRFDLTAHDSAEININLNPAMRRKKLAKPILAAACKYAFDILRLNVIYAEVKPENIPSVKIFEDVGFAFQGLRDGLRTYNLLRARPY